MAAHEFPWESMGFHRGPMSSTHELPQGSIGKDMRAHGSQWARTWMPMGAHEQKELGRPENDEPPQNQLLLTTSIPDSISGWGIDAIVEMSRFPWVDPCG